VLAGEAFEALAIQADGLYIDATFGRGGHTALILGALGPEGRVLAFDRDPAAIEAGHRRFPDDVRLALVGAPFADLSARVPRLLPGRPVRGILFDLGVSSPQLDDPARGFSFRADGPLDMRMDPASGEPVSAWLARAGEPEIREVIATLGEERFARRIAAQIVATRTATPITTTLQLAGIVSRAVRTREPGKHPATRTFQALRMFINDELGQLRAALAGALELLAVGGRLAVISFHSLEDRTVKQFIQAQSTVDPVYAGLPVIPEAAQPRLERIGSKVRAGAAELEINPRARSSVLRVARKVR
jgi:16S rRNA (cytosine1402-N4)-methyltransferase